MDLKKPVDEGDEIDLKCLNIGKAGDGICNVNGFVIIVPKMQPGQVARVRIRKVGKTVAFGEIIG